MGQTAIFQSYLFTERARVGCNRHLGNGFPRYRIALQNHISALFSKDPEGKNHTLKWKCLPAEI